LRKIIQKNQHIEKITGQNSILTKETPKTMIACVTYSKHAFSAKRGHDTLNYDEKITGASAYMS